MIYLYFKPRIPLTVYVFFKNHYLAKILFDFSVIFSSKSLKSTKGHVFNVFSRPAVFPVIFHFGLFVYFLAIDAAI